MQTAGQVGAAARERTGSLVRGEPLRHRRTLACTSWRRPSLWSRRWAVTV